MKSSFFSKRFVWQSPRGNRVVTHWASMLRWMWYSPSQVPTAKHVSYPQLTATLCINRVYKCSWFTVLYWCILVWCPKMGYFNLPGIFLPIWHGCIYNPQQLDKICLLWFHIGWIITSLFIFISIMFVYTFHCLLHCLGIILILYSNPLFWFCLSTDFLWHPNVNALTMCD